MFEAGRFYTAQSEEGGTARVECVKRTARQATFRCSERDMRSLGLARTRFTRRVEQMDVSDIDGRNREAVVRLSDRGDGRSWWISDAAAEPRRPR